MSAEVIHLKTSARPRLVEPPLASDEGFHEWELREAERLLEACALHIVRARAGGALADQSLTQAAHAAEGLVFHLLTAVGASNADLPLRRMLATRQTERLAT